jgi:hypothetical protein
MAYTRGGAWKAIDDRLLKRCYMSREAHNQKIRNRKQRADVGKHSFKIGPLKTGTNYQQATSVFPM